MDNIHNFKSKVVSILENASNDELLLMVNDEEVGHLVTKEVLRRMSMPKKTESVYVEVKTSKSFVPVSVEPVNVEPVKKYNQSFDKEETYEILTLLREGELVSHIAIAYGINPKEVNSVCKKIKDVELTLFNHNHYRYSMNTLEGIKKLSPHSREEVRNLVRQGISKKVIATRYHLSNYTMGQIESQILGTRTIEKWVNV